MRSMSSWTASWLTSQVCVGSWPLAAEPSSAWYASTTGRRLRVLSDLDYLAENLSRFP